MSGNLDEVVPTIFEIVDEHGNITQLTCVEVDGGRRCRICGGARSATAYDVIDPPTPAAVLFGLLWCSMGHGDPCVGFDGFLRAEGSASTPRQLLAAELLAQGSSSGDAELVGGGCE